MLGNYEKNDPGALPEDQKKECRRIIKRWEQLDTDAVNWKTYWQDCYELIVPRKENVVSTTVPGIQRNEDLFDSTAILANELLASALHGMLTNPEVNFLELTFGDPNLDEDDSVRKWAQELSTLMYRVLSNSNFQTEIYEIYVDLPAVGTACLHMDEDKNDVIRFSARALKEIRIDEDAYGSVNTVYRRFEMTPAQLVEQFGAENVPGEIRKKYDSGQSDKYFVIHAVEPKDFGENNLKGFKFKSSYILEKPQYPLSDSGYREFPYAVPRWSKTSGEKYGRGPGMAVLPDVRMVNAMMLVVLQGAQKVVDPPLLVEDDSVIGPVRLTPSGMTFVRPGSEKPTPLVTNSRIDFGQNMLEDIRARIRAGFYVDQLKLREADRMTTEEVRQRTEEALRLMGPVLGRQHFELLRPLTTKLYDIMERRGMIPVAPPKIRGKKFDVRYSSMIARAQRLGEAQNVSRAIGALAPLVQVYPHILDAFNPDKIARYIWETYGNKYSLLTDPRELQEMRAKRAQAEQQAQEMQQNQASSEMARNAAPMVSAMKQQGGMSAPQT